MVHIGESELAFIFLAQSVLSTNFFDGNHLDISDLKNLRKPHGDKNTIATSINILPKCVVVENLQLSFFGWSSESECNCKTKPFHHLQIFWDNLICCSQISLEKVDQRKFSINFYLPFLNILKFCKMEETYLAGNVQF